MCIDEYSPSDHHNGNGTLRGTSVFLCSLHINNKHVNIVDGKNSLNLLIVMKVRSS